MKKLLRLDWPDPCLMPNRKNGRHWASTHKAKREATACAWFEATQRGIEDIAGAPAYELVVEFYPPDRRKRDMDNLLAALKPAIDGIAHALGADDSGFSYRLSMAEPQKPGAVLVQIEPSEWQAVGTLAQRLANG